MATLGCIGTLSCSQLQIFPLRLHSFNLLCSLIWARGELFCLGRRPPDRGFPLHATELSRPRRPAKDPYHASQLFIKYYALPDCLGTSASASKDNPPPSACQALQLQIPILTVLLLGNKRSINLQSLRNKYLNLKKMV